MDIQRIDLDQIEVGQRLRPLNKAKVTILADSIAKIGLREPISVWSEPGASSAILVSGLHRLEATRLLGLTDIDCIFVNMNEEDRRLWEIAENLHRAELTDAERRQHIAEWVRLTAKKMEVQGPDDLIDSEYVFQSPHGAAIENRRKDGRGHRYEGAMAKAAKDLGLSKDTVARAVAAESLTPEAKAYADEIGLGTVARAKIARSSPEQQESKVHDIAIENKSHRARSISHGDSPVGHPCAREFAEWLIDRSGIETVPMLITWIEEVPPQLLISELRSAALARQRRAQPSG